ncbi:protein transport protein Sec31A-like [Choristoneura fumiferana]|uniref:protein transport protein Sec31A-like n=1 Tax=Choristoneura fumiferana TaxID=7141 RepID=UPI003D15E89D
MRVGSAAPTARDSTGLICRALVCGNLEEAVELCLEAKRVADALVIASLGSQELFYKVQKYHLSHTAKDPVSLIAGSLLQSQWQLLVQSAAATSWRDVLGALVTHCDGTRSSTTVRCSATGCLRRRTRRCRKQRRRATCAP